MVTCLLMGAYFRHLKLHFLSYLCCVMSYLCCICVVSCRPCVVFVLRHPAHSHLCCYSSIEELLL